MKNDIEDEATRNTIDDNFTIQEEYSIEKTKKKRAPMTEKQLENLKKARARKTELQRERREREKKLVKKLTDDDEIKDLRRQLKELQMQNNDLHLKETKKDIKDFSSDEEEEEEIIIKKRPKKRPKKKKKIIYESESDSDEYSDEPLLREGNASHLRQPPPRKRTFFV